MGESHTIISFDLRANMGIFKKPDTNGTLCMTYNMLHKPALLGILGAIYGLPGYKEEGELPEYYEKLNHLPIGVQPLGDDNGYFQKTVVSFNNSTGFASKEKGGNLIIREQVLIHPAYRCYLMLSLDNSLEKEIYNDIIHGKTTYMPYMGKNEYYAWWDNVKVYKDSKPFDFKRNFRVTNLFRKKEAVSQHVAKKKLNFATKKSEKTFFYFEKLPVDFDEEMHQYVYGDFVYTNADFDSNTDIVERTSLYDLGDGTIIQLI